MMKSYIFYFWILLTLHASAQSKPDNFLTHKDADPKAKALLKQVKDELKLDKGVEIVFDFKYYPAEGSLTHQKGTLQIKGKKFILNINDQELISDGTSLWTFLKKRNEVQIQEAKGVEDDPMSPFRLLQIHDSPDFTYILSGTTKEKNVSFDIVEFKPLDTKADFFKIKTEVDRVKKQYHKIVLYLKNGDQYALEIRSQVSKAIPENLFTWDSKMHAGVKVEDLR